MKNMIKLLKQRHPAAYQFIGFSLIGASAVLLMLIIYYIFIFLNFSPQIANFAGFLVSTAYSYIINYVYIFTDGGINKKNSAIKFFILYFVLYLFSAYMLNIIIDVWHISKIFAPIINGAFITLPSFFFSKYWVFVKK